MSLRDEITVLILTYNEEDNLARTLDALRWARQIVIVDSGSTDRTLEIAGLYPHVRVLQRPFDDFAAQCNFGLSEVSTPWVLSIDADYELSEAVSSEIETLVPGDVAGFRCRFVYRFYGRPLRASLYPRRTVLYRREQAHYVNEGHGHRVVVPGALKDLNGTIYHDDRKPLSRWLASQQRYAVKEADYLLSTEAGKLKRTDRLRRMGWPAPPLVFAYTLVWKRCLFDGWPGWLYVLQRVAAETMIALEVVDRRIQRSSAQSDASRLDKLK